MTILLIIVSLVLFYWNFHQQKAIRALRGNYDKVCNVLADELNVEDVKKRLEGITTKPALTDNKKIDDFPLTLNQLKMLRKNARSKRRLGDSYDVVTANKWVLPVVFKRQNTDLFYYRDKDGIWLISDGESDELMKFDNNFLSGAWYYQVVLDSSWIKEYLK